MPRKPRRPEIGDVWKHRKSGDLVLLTGLADLRGPLWDAVGMRGQSYQPFDEATLRKVAVFVMNAFMRALGDEIKEATDAE